MKTTRRRAGLSGCSRTPTPGRRSRGYDPRSAAAGRRPRLTLREPFAEGQHADVGAMILYEGQNTILDLCREFASAHTRQNRRSHSVRYIRGPLLGPEEIAACFGELGKAQSAHPAEPFDTAAAGARRCRLSARAIAPLDAFIEILLVSAPVRRRPRLAPRARAVRGQLRQMGTISFRFWRRA